MLRLVAAVLLPLLAACATNSPSTIRLMPTPEAAADGMLRGDADRRGAAWPGGGVLYATDRAAGPTDRSAYYGNAAGEALRVGKATIEEGSVQPQRDGRPRSPGTNLSLRVAGVDEYGVLSAPFLPAVETGDGPSAAARRRFAEEVNARLDRDGERDVFIYVHGFREPFENPILVGAELWRYLGYQGAFVAYSWPAANRLTAYVGDTETALATARNLRELVAFLETSTKAERIHIIAHSAGTRLTVRAMEQIALLNRRDPTNPRRLGRTLENVLLISSDLDRGAFVAAVADGLLTVQRHLIVYGSSRDRALQASRALSGHRRLGSLFADKALPDELRDLFRNNSQRLSYIDVTGVEGVNAGLGHSYFRSSPWVSSDMLMKLAYRLDPEARGLVRDPATGILSFPPDYVARMSAVRAAQAKPTARP